MDGRSRQRLGRRRMCALGLCALSALGTTHVGAGAPAQRFRIDATMQAQLPLQSSGAIALNAMLVPARANLVGGGFEMNANATDPASVCAGDTIFADDFEM